MQFVTNGPDIPDELLYAHEEGRVVFFCGAGISYRAKLPDFRRLVKLIYRNLGEDFEPGEKGAYKKKQYDTVLNMLERRMAGERAAVRAELKHILKPRLSCKGAIDTHLALLELARNRKGALRLVTTNFDYIFQSTKKCSGQSFEIYTAPTLPVPKDSRWDGLVYLHGLLSTEPSESELNRLVLTSGDFGLAYLIERWAARFVSELLRNYTVCFVGYSINDPILRYMMDALAADYMLGETGANTHYALGDFKPGKEDEAARKWRDRGVVPILYERPEGTDDHSLLYGTLTAWAKTYRDGTLGKERIIANHALTQPSASTQQDNYVGRVLWALSDETGLPAKQFANFNPVPSLEWLKEVFSKENFEYKDLHRFGVQTQNNTTDELKFSLVSRPPPYESAPRMGLLSTGSDHSKWDEVMWPLGHWLVRHLNDPELVTLLAQRGGQLHRSFAWLIRDKLEYIDKLQSKGQVAQLEQIQKHAPNAIPSRLMIVLWRLLLAGRIKSLPYHNRIDPWWKDFKRDGLTSTIRQNLHELLMSKITVSARSRWDENRETEEEPTRSSELVQFNIVLASDYARSFFQKLSESNNEYWQAALPSLLYDFQQILLGTLDLLRDLGEADDRIDSSHGKFPSISDHPQNRYSPEWIVLVELLRDAWLSMKNHDLSRAARIAHEWFELPYPMFKRLALFAARYDGCISSDDWVNWLLSDDGWWLWSPDTHREVMRLLVLQSRNLTPQSQGRLETAILSGPPSPRHSDNIGPQRLQYIMDKSVWLRLVRLKISATTFGELAQDRLDILSNAHSNWDMAINERDEFLTWMSSTGDPDHEEDHNTVIVPHKREEIVTWLKNSSELNTFFEDGWDETCRLYPKDTGYALFDLAEEKNWLYQRWSNAFYAWSENYQRCNDTWQWFSQKLQTTSDEALQKMTPGFTWWMMKTSESMERNDPVMLSLCQRMLNPDLSWSGESDSTNLEKADFFGEAMNYPIGHATRTLLHLWLQREPNDGDGLPGDIEPTFTQLCRTEFKRFLHGRVLLTSQLITFFHVDRSWTETHLLPLFNWKVDPREASAAWQGFLRSSRMHEPLLLAFKSQFLRTAHHYNKLGDYGHRYVALLTQAALAQVDGYSRKNFRKAIRALPPKGLGKVAQALLQALEGAGEQREDYYKDHIKPFWREIWPKSSAKISTSLTEPLALLCIAAREEFPSALNNVISFLRPISDSYYAIELLHESDLCKKFPKDALRLLRSIHSVKGWYPPKLDKCLEAIVEASSELKQNSEYRKLENYVRQQ